MDISALKLVNVNWKKHPSNVRYWYTDDFGGIILLRLNDFPDEPLHTVIYGLEIEDMDDPPNYWDIPSHFQ